MTAVIAVPPRPARSRQCYGAVMQGTVAEFDEDTRTGALLLDDGRRVEFHAEAFDASGLRLLRLGQRVHLDYDEQDRLVRVTLPTMREP
jgi:2-phospho-L-lactate/phosphoenolpyruvate guanylyltransferase